MYTYAFLYNPTYPLDLPKGISGALQIIKTTCICALAEPGIDLALLQSQDDLLIQAVLSHDRVIRSLFQQTPLLPLRFGTHFISKEGLLEHLQSNGIEYLKKLDGLVDKAEYTLKLTPLPLLETPIPTAVKGKDYFLAKKQRYQTYAEQQQQQVLELEEVREAIAQAYPTLIQGEPKDSIERVYLLVERQTEPLLQQHFLNWQTDCPHWDVSLGEALPPYHFV